ncbi:MAG TPA: hypothetical protein VF263_23225 [Longimicrobiaceae bacterium]
MHRFVRSLVPALSALALLVAPACADRTAPTPVEPRAADVAPVRSVSESGADLDQLATFRARRSVTIAWAKKWIGPEGGRLDFQGFAIVVPAGAVDRVTMFTINLPVDPKASERVVAEFGPHNRQFAKPLTIELPYTGTSAETGSATIVWWNEGWTDMGASLTADGSRLETQTTHFSTYGTTTTLSTRGNVVTTSGG